MRYGWADRGCGGRGRAGGRDIGLAIAAMIGGGRGGWGGEWPGGHGHGPMGGRGRARRMFDGGELRLVLLKLLADEPRHGYDLIRAVEAMTGGAYAPSPGIVYPTLTLLDEMSLAAEEQGEGTRRRFAATEAGRQHLAERAGEVEALMARLAALGAQRERTDGAPIRRALGNLRQAVHDRLARGDVSDDTLHDVAALIDELAQRVERLR